jgi:hypothetical protein
MPHSLRPWALVFSALFLYCLAGLWALGLLSTSPATKMAGDSVGYLAVGEWLFGLRPASGIKLFLALRPWVYPVFLALSEFTSGWTLLALQAGLWSAAVLLIYRLVLTLSQSKIRALAASVFYASLLGPLSLVPQALTETLCIFWLLGAAFLLTKYALTKNHLFLFFSALALALAAATRPHLLYLFVPLWGLSIYYVGRQCSFKRAILLGLIAALPVILQFVLVAHVFGTLKFSYIGEFTVYNYYLTKHAWIYHKNDIKQARSAALTECQRVFEQDRAMDFSAKVKNGLLNLWRTQSGQALYTWADSVLLNSTMPALSLSGHHTLTAISCWQNMLLSMLGAVLSLITLLKISYCRGRTTFSLAYAFIALSCLLNLAISGITIYQGDRISCLAYGLTLVLLFSFIGTNTAAGSEPKRPF